MWSVPLRHGLAGGPTDLLVSLGLIVFIVGSILVLGHLFDRIMAY
jgi:hypothetical protein